ncbi:MAG: trimeric intracellular cation channel family protein, partial [Spirochaetia bacterium]|nr:trimeric intracellular cation channel family protein [Spirochaetia bacterium]
LLWGVISAFGGVMVSDIMSRSVPTVLTSDFYATASLLGGIVYLLLEMTALSLLPKFLITTMVVFIIRLVAIKFNFQLPVAKTALPVEDHLSMHR